MGSDGFVKSRDLSLLKRTVREVSLEKVTCSLLQPLGRRKGEGGGRDRGKEEEGREEGTQERDSELERDRGEQERREGGWR